MTIWYRPPELLLGEHNYGTAVDMWSLGCVMAELWKRDSILKGSTDQNQLFLITQLCGSITPEVWPKVESLRLYRNMDMFGEYPRKVRFHIRLDLISVNDQVTVIIFPVFNLSFFY